MKQVLCISAIIIIISALVLWVRAEERKAALKAMGIIMGNGWAIIDGEFREY